MIKNKTLNITIILKTYLKLLKTVKKITLLNRLLFYKNKE